MKQERDTADWREARLDHVCPEITVGHVGPMASEYVEEGVPFLRSQNVEQFRLNRSELRYVSRAFHEKLRKSALHPGDVVVVRTGYPGTACVIPRSLPEANCADLVIIRPGPEIDPWFVASIFNSAWGRSTVAGKLVGIAQQHFNVGAAKSMRVRLPPLPIQQRISGILSTYDDFIENSYRRIKILEEMVRALYREWFVEFRAPGVKLRKATPVEKKTIGRDVFPEGWGIETLGDVLTLEYGRALKATDRVEGAVPVYGSSGIVGKHNIPLVKGPGIVVGRKGNVGSVFWTNDDFYPIDTVFFVKSSMSLHYLYFNLGEQSFLSGDAAVPGLNRGHAYRNPIVIPTPVDMERFEDHVGTIIRQMKILEDRLDNLRRTRDWILPRLMSGEVSVEHLESSRADDPVREVAEVSK